MVIVKCNCAMVKVIFFPALLYKIYSPVLYTGKKMMVEIREGSYEVEVQLYLKTDYKPHIA